MNSIEKFKASLSADPSNSDKKMKCVQEFYYVKQNQKIDALISFLHKAKAESDQSKYPRAAVFCNDYVHCLKLTLALNFAQIEALPACKSAIAQFNNDECSVLFITEECENLPDIDYSKFNVIINFDIPKDIETYFKRLGKVCAERSAKYASYVDPEHDADLLCEITRTLGVAFNDIFTSLSSFATKPAPLQLANRDKTPYASSHLHQQKGSVICSYEADITINEDDLVAAAADAGNNELDGADADGNEADSEDETTDDDNSEVSAVIKNAANVVGNEIEGVLFDIFDALCDIAKFSFIVAVFSVFAYFIGSSFSH